jgi:prepilin-type N-terminal cleavage/methylation domain-containing protein
MKRSAFSLIELLVVVAIIGILVSILLPSLGRARASGKLAVCASNLRQLGVGVTNYAHSNKGMIPIGPDARNGWFVNEGSAQRDLKLRPLASNQIWIGKPAPETPALGYTGLGHLLAIQSATPPVFYCPADMSEDEDEEQPRIGSDSSAYSSYVYRQMQMVPGRPLLGDMGDNRVQRASGADTTLKVQALAMDVQMTGPGPLKHLTHQGEKINILFQDTSVRDFANRNEWIDAPANSVKAGIFSVHDSHVLPALSSKDATVLSTRLSELFLRADMAYGAAEPGDAPIGRPVSLTP